MKASQYNPIYENHSLKIHKIVIFQKKSAVATGRKKNVVPVGAYLDFKSGISEEKRGTGKGISGFQVWEGCC